MSSTSQQVNLPPHLQLQQQKFDNYQLKWHSHLSNLNTAISTLYKNEKYADVMLFTCNKDENYCIPAHKLILSSYSSYFTNIFDSNSLLNDNNKLIYIVLPPDITKRSIKILIQYMYNGEATVSKDIIQEVLHSGEVLKIRGLCRYNKTTGTTNTNNITKTINIEKTPANPDNSQKIQVKEIDKLLPVNVTKVNTTKGVGTSVIIKDNQNQNVIVLAKPLKQQTQTVQKAFINPTTLSMNNITFIPSNATTITGSATVTGTPTLSTTSLKKITIQRYANETNTSKLDESNIIKENIFLNDGKGIKRKNSLNYLNDKDNENSNDAIIHSNNHNNNGLSNNCNKRQATTIQRTISNEMIFTPDELNFLTVKQEPMEWPNYNEDSLDIINGNTDNIETIIKPEALSFCSDDSDNNEFTEAIYSPLTCDVCNEVFTLPADWVKHIESHSEQREFSEDTNSDSENAILTCNLCSLNFLTPADWVRHVQNSHTERELALSNKKTKPRQSKDDGLQLGTTCSICNKKFPSNTSMNLHINTHREDNSYYCTLCHRGFSVKSNLSRHIRTVHKCENLIKNSNNDSETDG